MFKFFFFFFFLLSSFFLIININIFAGYITYIWQRTSSKKFLCCKKKDFLKTIGVLFDKENAISNFIIQ